MVNSSVLASVGRKNRKGQKKGSSASQKISNSSSSQKTKSMGTLPRIVEAFVILTLCIIFLRFFGLSTFEKWERKDVQIVRRKEPRDFLPAPAVTICPINAESASGWKLDTLDNDPALDICKGEEDMEDCVKMNTFTLEEVVSVNGSSRLTYLRNKTDLKEEGEEFINSTLWTSRMTETTNGMCHTLTYDKDIGKRTYLQIGLNYNFTAVFLHDPKFFVFKDTNVLIPFLKLNDVFNKEFIILATTKKRMRRESKFDCNRDKNYDFGDCVRQKIVESQGCQTPWDRRPADKVPKCSSVKSMKEFESYYHQVFFSSEKELKELTGCLFPCTYTHYSLAETYSFESNETEFVINYALTDLITEQEVLLFPFDSLVSELGGALGLFLGFSFLGAVSTMQSWVMTVLSMFKTNKHQIGPLSD